MGATSLGLLFLAATLHTLANVLVKKARNKLAFTWWMLAMTSVLGLPLWSLADAIDVEGWQFIAVSGVLEAIYFVALTRAYTYGDLSQVYPLARGSAPLFIAVWAILFLGERLSAAGLCGIMVIVTGLYLINLPSLAAWNRPLLHLESRASRWALLTGLLISAYATVDKKGVERVDPTVYLYLVMVVSCIALAPMWMSRPLRKALVSEIRSSENGSLVRGMAWIAAGALFGMAGYILVLTAMRLSPVGYVGAVREVSVVIGAWIGIRFLGEAGGALRILASALVVAGILIIAIAG